VDSILCKRHNYISAARRRYAFALVICFIAIFIITSLLVIAGIEHNCTGKDCIICAKISIAKDVLQQIGRFLSIGFLSGTLLLMHFILTDLDLGGMLLATPCEHKIKLNI